MADPGAPDAPEPRPLPRLVTGIGGLDTICGGGLPLGEVTLLAGRTGTGKSVLAAQFLAAGITGADEPGVFVTLEDSPEKTRRFLATFGWDLATWEAEGRWLFLDASPSDDHEVVLGHDVDLSPLIARIAAAVGQVGAKRVVVDSISDVLTRIGDRPHVRAELRRLVRNLERLGVTSIVTAERDHDDAGASGIGGFGGVGVEEFVADNVLTLRNTLVQGTRRRSLEALKLRGTRHLTGEFSFVILPAEGVVIASTTDLRLTHPATDDRVSMGNAGLDEMCGGGALRGSMILVSGPTGSGKSLLALEFTTAPTDHTDRSLMVSFEESHDQLARNARSWGHDLRALEAAGRLTILCDYPEAAPTASHLVRIQRAIDELKPTRVVLDSLSGIERASSPEAFHEFLLGLTALLKSREITTLLTTTTPWLLGGPTATGVEASTLLDAIILMRYVEVRGELHRGVSVLKMRGSDHVKAIREFTITSRGLEVDGIFQATTGILAGRPLIGDAAAPFTPVAPVPPARGGS
jgi:circadian clock protein KaiC